MAPGSALPLYTVLPFILMLLVIAVLPLSIPHWWEKNRNKLLVACVLGLPILVLYVGRDPKALVRMGEEYLLVHHSARRPLRDLGWRAPPRRPGRHPADQHGLPGGGIGAGLLRRDHGSVDAADPAAAPDQPGADTGQAHGRLLHLHRIQHRRHAHPAGRSPALPRVSAGRSLHVDLSPLAVLAPDGRAPAGHLLRLGFDAIRAGIHRRHSPGPHAARTPSDPRRASTRSGWPAWSWPSPFYASPSGRSRS